MKYIIYRHAQTEMERRNIPQALVESVLNAPGQVKNICRLGGTK
ncbi:MAG: hypothetical protein V7L27_26055 [Nostoc sp.]